MATTYRCSGLVIIAVICGLAVTGTRAATALEVTARNDSVRDFSQAAILPGFVAEESAAAWLTAPCDGDVIKVQILWLSLFGGAPDSLQDSITVFDEGAFPEPGAQRVVLSGPVLRDGFFNEFTLPIAVPRQQGDVFVVSLKFFEDPPPTGPSVVTDIDGCQSGKNAIFAIPPAAWVAACPLGLSGDFAIRAVMECPDSIFVDGFESGDLSAWSLAVP